MDITDIYRLLHPSTTEYTFFSRSHGTFTKTDHVLGRKTHLNKFKRIEVIQCLPTEHNEIKLEISNEKITGKSQDTWRLNKILLNNTWVKEEISGTIFKYFVLDENENIIY